ncbi:cysteine desulfurase, partial [bacterium]|nr:cysteine desulfurase [bacterium]
MDPIYLDYNATTPIDDQVARAMMPYITEHFGNPSSKHEYGRVTWEAVEMARWQVSKLLRCQPEEVVFTSGGTESNNYAIIGAALANREKGSHIITSAIEHPAVTEVCRYLEGNGFSVTYLPVDQHGLVDVGQVEDAITDQTILISVMHANNEVGTIQPIRKIAQAARQRGILMHTDAAQSLGKIPAQVDDLGVDLLSVAGHKLYAPKGVGALYIRDGVKLQKLIHGANHESGRRAGTENVILTVALGEAAVIAEQQLDQYTSHMKEMRDKLEQALQKKIPGLRLNGHPEKRLPNTCSVGFPGVIATRLLAAMQDVAASPGAACHSDGSVTSAVLTAMGVAPEIAAGTIRFSVGRHTIAEEIDQAVDSIV